MPRPFQVPPNVKLAIGSDTEHYVRMVGVGEADMTPYNADTEYWRHNNLAATNLNKDLLLSHGSITNRTTIDSHFGSFATSFDNPRTNPTWTSGRYTPTGSAYLYSLPDPDDTRKTIGILLETQTSNSGVITLKLAAFYKENGSGQIWATETTPGTTLTQVKDSTGAATTNPAYLDGSGSWSGNYTLMQASS